MSYVSLRQSDRVSLRERVEKINTTGEYSVRSVQFFD